MIEVYERMPREALPSVDDVTPEEINALLDTEVKDAPELQPNQWLCDETGRLQAVIDTGEPRERALAKAQLAMRLTLPEPERACELASDALSVGQEIADQHVMAIGHAAVGSANWFRDVTDWRTPSVHALEAEYLANDLGLRVWEAKALTLRMHTAMNSGSVASAVGMSHAIEPLLQDPADGDDEFIRLYCLAMFHFVQGILVWNIEQDGEGERNHLALAVAFARAAHSPLLVAHVHHRLAFIARHGRKYSTAKAHLARERLIAARHNNGFHILGSLELMAAVHTEEGDFVTAWDVLEEADRLVEETRLVWPLAQLLLGFRKIKLLVAEKRWDEAEERLDRIAPLTERTLRSNIVVMLETYIEIYRAKGTLNEHLDVYDRLLKESKRISDERGSAQRLVANDLRQSGERRRERHAASALRAILPDPAYSEITEAGEAQPRYYPNTVLFYSDFAGFTRIASALTPRQVMEELSDLFENFDLIMADNGCDRIETIGDAYLAIAGLRPEGDGMTREEGARSLARAALEIQGYLSARNARARSIGGPEFVARVGVHAGPIIGGIVGRKKIRYGVFGDAVNTAQRLEAACTPGEILVSEATHALLEPARLECGFALRGAGEITPKGKASMSTWVLTGPATDRSAPSPS